jgi:hypothetical protein
LSQIGGDRFCFAMISGGYLAQPVWTNHERHYRVGHMATRPPPPGIITAPALDRAIQAVTREAIFLRLRRLRRLQRRGRRVTVAELKRDHIETLLEVTRREHSRRTEPPLEPADEFDELICDCHWTIGAFLNRLAYYGIITRPQFDAAIEFVDLIRDYPWTIGAPLLRARPSKIERAKLAAISREDEGRSRLELEDFPSGFQSELQCRDGSPLPRQSVTNAHAKAALRAWLERKVAEYLSGGGKITACPLGHCTIAIKRRDPHAYVPGNWRSGYAPFRRNGVQMYCPSPDAADPDSEGGKYVADDERKLCRRLDRARAALRNAGQSAERIVRRLCEDDIIPAEDTPTVVLVQQPAEITDFKRGLDALRKSLHHASNKPVDDAPRIKRELRALKRAERQAA